MGLGSDHNDILHGFRRGEDKAVRHLYDSYYRPLCYFANRLLNDKAAAEDIVVDAFLKLLGKREDFDNLASVKSFLYTAVRNACIDLLRRNKRHNQAGRDLEYLSVPDDEALEQEMILARVMQAIYAEVENLPAQCRRVFSSVFIEGKSTTDVAAELGISPQTVLNQKTKAVRLLRMALYRKGLYTASLFPLLLFHS